jgi:hypothetical protein
MRQACRNRRLQTRCGSDIAHELYVWRRKLFVEQPTASVPPVDVACLIKSLRSVQQNRGLLLDNVRGVGPSLDHRECGAKADVRPHWNRTRCPISFDLRPQHKGLKHDSKD